MARFLKLYPGDRDFREVSEKEWEAPFEPFGDRDGFGNILNLTADVRVFDRPGGKLLLARKWPSRSFIRNFARFIRMMTSGSNIDLIRREGTTLTTQMTTDGPFSSAGLHPRRDLGLRAMGAGMAVGDGTPAEDHLRNDLVNRVGDVVLAGESVATTADNATTLTLQITQGITISQSGGITAREIGLFGFFRAYSENPATVEGTPILLAYDGITNTPVAQGGVIAPRYTLNFPV